MSRWISATVTHADAPIDHAAVIEFIQFLDNGESCAVLGDRCDRCPRGNAQCCKRSGYVPLLIRLPGLNPDTTWSMTLSLPAASITSRITRTSSISANSDTQGRPARVSDRTSAPIGLWSIGDENPRLGWINVDAHTRRRRLAFSCAKERANEALTDATSSEDNFSFSRARAR